MRRVWLAAVVIVSSLGCGGKSKPAPSAPAPAPAISNTAAEAEAPPPAPPPPPVSSTGVPECDEYLAVFDDIMERCADKLGPARDAMKEARDAMTAAFEQWRDLDAESQRATYEAAAPGCKAGIDGLKQSVSAMGCVL